MISSGLVAASGQYARKPSPRYLLIIPWLIFDDLLATKNPCSNKNLQVLALHLAAERRKTADVRDEKPARDILDFAQCSLHHVRFVLL